MYFIEKIREQRALVWIIASNSMDFKRRGRGFICDCPVCNEQGALTVDEKKQVWRCFGRCGVGGDIFTFIIARFDYSFTQAVTWLAGQLDLPLAGPETGRQCQEIKDFLLGAFEDLTPPMIK